ncbi:hypothetical protein GOBAR_AA38100 [Gossypium barbadense]|uniref:Uncharacterized protein n=1 Tax=Gossypium barbadense TaxID=3634 RepID=A0A2P5VUU6_GOSBA|nr:hypothetical protein GOBAR_AA38100 [Gossypium barbadense]
MRCPLYRTDTGLQLMVHARQMDENFDTLREELGPNRYDVNEYITFGYSYLLDEAVLPYPTVGHSGLAQHRSIIHSFPLFVIGRTAIETTGFYNLSSELSYNAFQAIPSYTYSTYQQGAAILMAFQAISTCALAPNFLTFEQRTPQIADAPVAPLSPPVSIFPLARLGSRYTLPKTHN